MINIQLIKKQTFIVVVFFLPVITFSQIIEEWVTRYNGTGNADDHAERIIMDAEGNLYVTGWSAGLLTGHDYSTVKYNLSGVQQWVAIYNGPGNANDVARSVKIDASGNIYVIGSSVGNGTGFDFATIKYNAAGEQLWVARYDDPSLVGDQAVAIDVDPSGNIYVTGWSEDDDHTTSWATIKYDSSGVQEWVKKDISDHPTSLVVDAFGNVVVTGASRGDYCTIKYSLSGEELWVKTYNGSFNERGDSADEAIAIAVDISGNVYVTGSSNGDEFLPWGTDPELLLEYATIKYSSAGEELW